MSQAYICDTCQKHEAPKDSFNLPPEGWYLVYQRTAPTAHLCSPICLAEHAHKAQTPSVKQAVSA